MKKYFVQVTVDGFATREIEAENPEDAKIKAYEGNYFNNLNTGELENTELEVIDITET